ncbi:MULTISPECIES: SDR family oxidoreductase [Rhizobium]|uniref:NAD(P)-dependent dehydrogenase (Short-subunit alcohol dehydrogenase family) n=1 Tax=Rhizobium tropici TaxID=398 RepID=A0A6P1CI09_RHITR|nr:MULTISPECIES: SDR family oxidoreductase [Rhizobium]AGB74043.1 2,5-dichloro-2,5-cyclohexadiene-1,4-diol dehydrogenase [Rhizobium tropici CIAT 899]MBB4240531.1 NAD(P)-dependent dehydrogenase (short-subunit alcohol dehydrogenase family) [Rhizobium tropici]MBB5592053.1 NAD(P)-dependent dehydrogenase (short-subunit alcohol dehydrogenase family) [Rhizobium tropici]MBB6491107.1 NAD(P)-dependent dehydrogenase (short-subunit alcohol dehydrogenase family) [Rhizobium tropici]NEV15383.1 SDR family oxid
MNRSIVVTGAASGIGKATAELLESRGDRVVRVDIRNADINADLATIEGRAEAVALLKESLKDGVDGIVTWAGLGGPVGATLLVNFFGTIDLVEGIHPLLLMSTAPRVVVTSSRMSLEKPNEEIVALLLKRNLTEIVRRYPSSEDPTEFYCATKVAINRWMRHLAVSPDWGGRGIKVNAIAPGLTETPMTRSTLDNDVQRQYLLAMHPQAENVLSQPIELAEIARFLVGPESSMLIGQCIYADRGTEAILRGVNPF